MRNCQRTAFSPRKTTFFQFLLYGTFYFLYNSPSALPPCILRADHVVITEAANVDAILFLSNGTFDVITQRSDRNCRTAALNYSHLTLSGRLEVGSSILHLLTPDATSARLKILLETERREV